MRHQRFAGGILGVGTTGGVRIVVGRWEDSPFGPFADVFLEDGEHRVLLAPETVADFVSSTYGFDEVVAGPVQVVDREVEGHRAWQVRGSGLALDVVLGARSWLGWALRGIPTPLATSRHWARAISPVAAIVMPGVRTWGSAGNGRIEAYGAWDHHRVLAVRGRWQGRELGTIARLDPPVRFGFGSTPASPSLTSIVTTVSVPAA